jgi:hypothetical protein
VSDVAGRGRAWPRLSCLVIVASDADTNGYLEKSARSRESVPAASLRIGTGLGEIRGRQANDVFELNAGLDFQSSVVVEFQVLQQGRTAEGADDFVPVEVRLELVAAARK